MSRVVDFLCSIGGANLTVLKKCPSEKRGFRDIGIVLLIVYALSIITAGLLALNNTNNALL